MLQGLGFHSLQQAQLLKWAKVSPSHEAVKDFKRGLLVLPHGQFIIMNTCSELCVVREGRAEERLQGMDGVNLLIEVGGREFIMENNNNGDTALHDVCP